MDKRAVVGIVVIIVIVLLVIGSAFMSSGDKSDDDTSTTKTTISSKQSENSDNSANITTDRENILDDKDNPNKNNYKNYAHYVKFVSIEQFKNTEGVRALFFYRESSKPSKLLDKDIRKHLDIYDQDTTIFRIDIDENEDLAKAYGVINDATVLRFDKQGKVDGVFLATDNPSAVALRTNLQI